MKVDVSAEMKLILSAYSSEHPSESAEKLKQLWLEFQPASIEAIKAEQRRRQETVGIPVPVLKAIAKELGKQARKDVQHVHAFIPLARTLWHDFGREGRVVSALILGGMEVVAPDTIVPLIMDLCRSCVTWEDADRLAMDALEPIVRKDPEQWLSTVEPWLDDENKWVRRAGVTVVARLPMKHPSYTERCLQLAERLLSDQDTDVKRAVSFAIRLAARGQPEPVREFLARHVPPSDADATWVLCDAIRSMTKRFLPHFTALLPLYVQWASDPQLSSKDRRSVESAVRILRAV